MITWLRKWWWMLLLGALAILLYCISGGRATIDLDAVKKMADAQAEAKKLEAKFGRDAAKKKIEEQHAETIKQMDEHDRKEAETLTDDPGERARFYARVAAKHARRA